MDRQSAGRLFGSETLKGSRSLYEQVKYERSKEKTINDFFGEKQPGVCY